MSDSPWTIHGKFAIVTGAGSGILFAFAAQLLEAGCSVLFADIALRPEAEELVAQYPHPAPSSGKPSAVFRKTDQASFPSISECWAFALQTFGRIDLVCPGAGIWEPPESAFWEAPGISPLSKDDAMAELANYKLLAVDLIGPIRFAQIAMDYWLAEETKMEGSLLLVASQSAYAPTVGTPLYNAAKGGLVSFTRGMSQMKARTGIRVSCMCPSTTFTPATEMEYCKEKVRPQDMNMTAAECAAIMMNLVTQHQYGNGECVEGMQFGTKEKSDVRVRAVPYERLMPDGIDPAKDFAGKNIFVEEEKLWEQLKTKGMRP